MRLKLLAKNQTRRGVQRHVDTAGKVSDARVSGAGGRKARLVTGSW